MTMFTKDQKKIIALSSLGGALEFYDFACFALLSKILSELFFPLQDVAASLMAVFATFAVGYFARPLGAFLFSHWGDRFGRKKPFVATVFLMAIPTFLIGCLPTYEQMGVSATVLLILLRLLQGFSLGGEIPGAVVFIGETVNQERRGFAIGSILGSVNVGLLIGALVTSVLLQKLPAAMMLSWGWRVVFWSGGVLGIISFYLRKRLQETPFFNALAHTKSSTRFPFKEVLFNYPKETIQSFLVVALGGTLTSFFYFYMPTYLATFFKFSLSEVMSLTTFNIFLLSFSVFFFGWWSDRYGRKNIVLGSIAFFAVFTYLIFKGFHLNSWLFLVIATLIINVFIGAIAGGFLCTLVELYPTAVRYTGVALVYNVGVGIVGSLSPLLATVFVKVMGNVIAPAFYLMALAWLALIAMWFLPETYKRDLA